MGDEKVMRSKRIEAYNYIKTGILNQEWQSSQAIDVNELSEKLNMSRTPIMEALTRLEDEGIVRIVPQVGAFIRQHTKEEAYEVLVIRAVLEGMLVERATPHLDQKFFDELDFILNSMEKPDITSREYANLNKDFHLKIYQATGMPNALALIRKYWNVTEYLAISGRLFKTREDISYSILEHKMIYHHLKMKNALLARQLMENHLLRVAQNQLSQHDD
ncbi:GntR family transcriptional regulator [Brevibacillus sp. NRS-1366]|uniref:GntR family transcriptional regulator n=1 Tax=Brevibacillus sp. NRS-1366 TaxID=3233899 RepID=UPI003D217FC3